jgi:PIN domain nuclease of toxin-antitoxin system
MKLLLDTCAFLWMIAEPARLSRRARDLVTSSRSELFLSAASSWEMAIKAAIGSLHFSEAVESFVPEQMAQNAIRSLPIEHVHALHVATLPRHHRDPFDRLLIAQSKLEGLPLLSPEKLFDRYAVERVW